MAKMIGRKGMENWHCKCCGDPIPKNSVKGKEERVWRKDAFEEAGEHFGGICPVSPIHGCPECTEWVYEGNGPEDLEGIEGVTFVK